MKAHNHLLKFTITAFAVICFFASCDDNLKEIQKMQMESNEPVGVVDNMLLKHTDSGRMKLVLQGKTMLDFSNDDFPYTQFPDGIQVDVLEYKNDSPEKTTITADFATMYDETGLVNLEGNVKIVTSDGNTFQGEQLYWDQTSKWIFTNQNFEAHLVDNDNQQNVAVITGSAWDARENMTQSLSRNSNDIIIPQQSTSQNE